jgi:hypothetical protein
MEGAEQNKVIFWGRSSAWIERKIVDLEVAGSSPVVPAKNTQSAAF